MSAQAAAERAELLKVARHPKTFTDEQWTQMRTRWREQLKREAEKVRVAREQEDAVRHRIKVCWYLCSRCLLAFSGTQAEYDREQARERESQQIAEPQFAAAMAQLGPESQETT